MIDSIYPPYKETVIPTVPMQNVIIFMLSAASICISLFVYLGLYWSD